MSGLTAPPWPSALPAPTRRPLPPHRPAEELPGVSMRRLKVAGQISAGITFIELDDVKVPVENLISTKGIGMKYVID